MSSFAALVKLQNKNTGKVAFAPTVKYARISSSMGLVTGDSGVDFGFVARPTNGLWSMELEDGLHTFDVTTSTLAPGPVATALDVAITTRDGFRADLQKVQEAITLWHTDYPNGPDGQILSTADQTSSGLIDGNGAAALTAPISEGDFTLDLTLTTFTLLRLQNWEEGFMHHVGLAETAVEAAYGDYHDIFLGGSTCYSGSIFIAKNSIIQLQSNLVAAAHRMREMGAATAKPSLTRVYDIYGGPTFGLNLNAVFARYRLILDSDHQVQVVCHDPADTATRIKSMFQFLSKCELPSGRASAYQLAGEQSLIGDTGLQEGDGIERDLTSALCDAIACAYFGDVPGTAGADHLMAPQVSKDVVNDELRQISEDHQDYGDDYDRLAAPGNENFSAAAPNGAQFNSKSNLLNGFISQKAINGNDLETTDHFMATGGPTPLTDYYQQLVTDNTDGGTLTDTNFKNALLPTKDGDETGAVFKDLIRNCYKFSHSLARERKNMANKAGESVAVDVLSVPKLYNGGGKVHRSFKMRAFNQYRSPKQLSQADYVLTTVAGPLTAADMLDLIGAGASEPSVHEDNNAVGNEFVGFTAIADREARHGGVALASDNAGIKTRYEAGVVEYTALCNKYDTGLVDLLNLERRLAEGQADLPDAAAWNMEVATRVQYVAYAAARGPSVRLGGDANNGLQFTLGSGQVVYFSGINDQTGTITNSTSGGGGGGGGGTYTFSANLGVGTFDGDVSFSSLMGGKTTIMNPTTPTSGTFINGSTYSITPPANTDSPANFTVINPGDGSIFLEASGDVFPTLTGGGGGGTAYPGRFFNNGWFEFTGTTPGVDIPADVTGSYFSAVDDFAVQIDSSHLISPTKLLQSAIATAEVAEVAAHVTVAHELAQYNAFRQMVGEAPITDINNATTIAKTPSIMGISIYKNVADDGTISDPDDAMNYEAGAVSVEYTVGGEARLYFASLPTCVATDVLTFDVTYAGLTTAIISSELRDKWNRACRAIGIAQDSDWSEMAVQMHYYNARLHHKEGDAGNSLSAGVTQNKIETADTDAAATIEIHNTPIPTWFGQVTAGNGRVVRISTLKQEGIYVLSKDNTATEDNQWYITPVGGEVLESETNAARWIIQNIGELPIGTVGSNGRVQANYLVAENIVEVHGSVPDSRFRDGDLSYGGFAGGESVYTMEPLIDGVYDEHKRDQDHYLRHQLCLAPGDRVVLSCQLTVDAPDGQARAPFNFGLRLRNGWGTANIVSADHASQLTYGSISSFYSDATSAATGEQVSNQGEFTGWIAIYNDHCSLKHSVDTVNGSGVVTETTIDKYEDVISPDLHFTRSVDAFATDNTTIISHLNMKAASASAYHTDESYRVYTGVGHGKKN